MNPAPPDPRRVPSRLRSRTKIVATIGPASEGRIGDLIDAGMDVARINFSHGEPREHRRRVEAVRGAAGERGRAVGILADIPGPKLRLGRFEGGERTLMEGEVVRVLQGDAVAGPGEILFDFGGFLQSVAPGHRMMLADGQAALTVEEVRGDSVVARVARPGVLGDRKGVHLPDSPLDYELPTPRDRECVELAVSLGVDMLGISFVGRAEEVECVRSLAPGMAMVAKIERSLALENLEAILEASDGVMVARGDLGVELDLERVPIVQKALLRAARDAACFSITATEMLESMTGQSRPTRAEVADVANAVLDGTDALMLSAETAVGSFPVEAVRTMGRVAAEVEGGPDYTDRSDRSLRREWKIDTADAIAIAAARLSGALEIPRIVCFTESGRSVRLVSRCRPSAEIIALSPDERVVRQMTVLAHVRPMVFPRVENLEDMLARASRMLKSERLVDEGAEIVFVAGVPAGVSRSTNLVKVHRVGEDVKLH
ncbi:MAG: pyruvate kinase [Planctomycetota bacterium]|jgi:pyruvate kinase|nr:pyruvate kinase [Planctomycetota bacterium]MDP6761829.1 pyruvate kinase [Planctomycetota bacterium]MDP6988875.1 pyruvate kinase [Planctomycetota bacterium]